MAKNTNNNQIFVERETFEKNGRTFFSYFIKGNIRGKDVKVAVVPPDRGGYTVLDIVFGDYLEYVTEKASVDELKMQNSYFINSLYRDTDETGSA